MSTLRRGALVLVLLALVAACDTDDPLTVSSQTAELFIAASNATVPIYDVWEVFQDNDDDGADDIDGDGSPDTFLFCERQGVGQAQSTPWGFRIEVFVTSADGATSRRITSTTAFTGTSGNRALYDEPFPPGSSPLFLGNPQQNPTGITPPVVINDAGTPRTFLFENPIRSFETSRSLATAVTNPLHELRPVFFDGLCPGATLSTLPGGVPGEAMIDNNTQPLTFVLNEGETVTVRAILGDDPPPGYEISSQTEPRLDGALVIGGQNVVPQGTTQGETISFTYTVR